MPIELTIRRGVEADLAPCAALYERVVRETFVWIPDEDLTDAPFWEAAPEEELYVAELGGSVVGFASLYRPEDFLHSLYVEWDARGQGVGSALFERVREAAGRPIWLKVQKLNTAAIAFYERRGLTMGPSGDEDAPGGGWFRMGELA